MTQIIKPDYKTPEVADILHLHLDDYKAEYPLWPEHHKIATNLLDCRTARLGGHIERCDNCGAVTEYKKAVQLAPKSPPLYLYLAVINILLEREEEARASAEKALELAPFISVAFVSQTSRYKNQADLKLVLDAMRKAGFPE